MMRLQRLGLEFFGHFTNKWLDFGDKPEGSADFHLIYGPNEAGKTTVMEGYLRLLYRFQHKEPYDFKHKRSNLKVSAALLLDDKIQEFTRLPGRNNNLVDQTGAPLLETTLQSALSGLLIDDYRNLFCLDDLTIEEGGNEIANSKGDIGRLLFSAAAGVSDLSEVLDAVDERSANLFKKGGTKSEFALLKRSLDDVTAKIRETDISVTMYRQQKQALDDAIEIEMGVREQRKEKLNAQARLKAIAKALPMSAKIRELERELEPLDHFPISQDIDTEALIELSNQRSLLVAALERFESLISDRTKARDAIILQPDIVQTLNRLEDQRNLRARCGTAATDLPRRQSQRDDIIKDMKRSLVDIGIINVDAPEQFVFDSAHLQELERKFQAVSEAEAVLNTAESEKENALENLETAEKTIGELPLVSEDDTDLQHILDLRNASHILAESNKVKEALRLAQRSAYEALSQLSFDGQNFDTVPELPLSSEEASTLVRNIETAKVAVANAEDELCEAEGVVEQLGSSIDTLEDSGMIITDEEAGVSRNERDRLWREHLGDLSGPSAKSFESAMHLDDTKSAARHSQAKELAQVRQLKFTLSEASSKSQGKRSALKKASERLDIFQSQLQGHLSTTGLKAGLSAVGFADWVRKVETARAQKIVEDNEQFAATSILEEAELLKKELADVLNAPSEKLGTLITLASKTATERERKLTELRITQKILIDAKTEHQKRMSKKSKAAEMRNGVKIAWSIALDEAFGDVGQNIPFPQAFNNLHEMRELNGKLLGLCRQIDGMVTDQKALDEALMPLIANAPELDSGSTINIYDALVSKAEAATRAYEMQIALVDEIDDAQGKLQSAQDELDDIDLQVGLLAKIFDTTIPTKTVDELRQAVLQGNRAIELRGQTGRLSSDLCLVLDVQSRTDSEDELQEQSLPMVEASISEVERDLSGIETDLTRSIEERARAEVALNAIRGDADVATLVTHRQTIELEMESVILNFLELRIGHMLADTAIQRYRNSHRSGMMKTAETAFKELTNGAYSGLTTQVDGAKEILLAIQSSDGAAKQAQALSKGTRFQLYLALRAAAYEQMAANGTILPFFCDDVFETFDEDRTRAACGLMRRIGQTGQAIYLTHHKHVVRIAQEVCGEDVRVHEI